MENTREMVSILQAAKHLGVSRRTVYYWLNRGKLRYLRTPGGAIRIFADDLWREPGPSTSREAPVLPSRQV